MANPTTSVRDYCVLLAKSKLLPAEEVEALYRRWREDTRGQDDQVDSFRKFLIARRYLTDWQAAILQRGRADGFFVAGYKILDRVGKGQMGGVYKAVHALGQVVALKILPASKAKDQHTLGRFQREARLLTQLDHPNVVRAFQVGEDGGRHFIVMEYLEGESLEETLARRRRLPWAEAVRLVHQASGGLQHLHDRRTVHRDLKPANMMLTPPPGKPDVTWDATLKILDIGLGREMFADDTPEGQIDTQLTVEGAVLGTPDYLAPEQAKDARSADIRADIYSLGCVLYHCLTGRPPFPETNIMTQMLKHATEKPAPVTSFVPDIPPGLVAVLDRMLAKSPDERYQTPAEAADALKPFVGTAGVSPVPTSIVPAFKDWLESESQLELPKGTLPPAKPVAPAKPAAAKPGSAPVPMPAGTPAPKPAAPKRPVAPRPVAKPQAPRPVAPEPPPEEVEVEVELVVEPAGGVGAAGGPGGLDFQHAYEPPPPAAPPERKLWELDRRDWIMLAAGAAGVLAAVGFGFGLARLFRKKPEDLVPPEE